MVPHGHPADVRAVHAFCRSGCFEGRFLVSVLEGQRAAFPVGCHGLGTVLALHGQFAVSLLIAQGNVVIQGQGIVRAAILILRCFHFQVALSTGLAVDRHRRMLGSLVVHFLQLGFRSGPAGFFILIQIRRIEFLVGKACDGAGVFLIAVRFPVAVNGDAADGSRAVINGGFVPHLHLVGVDAFSVNGGGHITVGDGQGSGAGNRTGRRFAVSISPGEHRTFGSRPVGNRAAVGVRLFHGSGINMQVFVQGNLDCPVFHGGTDIAGLGFLAVRTIGAVAVNGNGLAQSLLHFIAVG